MAQIPQELLDVLSAAEDARVAALVKDDEHGLAVTALVKATGDEKSAADAALEAHRVAGDKAQAAFDAVKAHFQL